MKNKHSRLGYDAMNHITIHAADTYPDMDIGVAEITRWHTDRGWRHASKHSDS